MNDTDFNRAIALLACVLALLALPASFLSDRSFESVFNEDGLVEWIAFAAWLILAAVLFRAAVSEGGAVAWLAAPVCLAAALREADLHNRLTGFSILKLRFFTGDAFPLWEKVLAALVVVPIGVALVLLAVAFVRRLLGGGLRHGSVRLVLVTVGLLVFSKLVDRAPAVLFDWYGIEFSTTARRWMLAYEEGIEALLPVAFLIAFLAARKERRQSSSALVSSRGLK